MKRTLVIIAAFLFFIWGLPAGLNGREKSVKIRVMTYNTHHCNPPAVKGLIDAQAIADVIKSNNVDIALLQEIDVRTSRVKGVDLAEELSQRSGLNYFHFFKAIDLLGGEYGVMILSKYPLDSSKVYPLYKEGASEQRVLGTAFVTLPNNLKVMIACTHLDLSAKLRIAEIKEIDSILSKSSMPVILGGDFNATPQSNEMVMMTDGYMSTTNEFVPTFPNIDPNKTIDYIFLSRNSNFRILKHKALENINASDHLPVIADIRCSD